MKINLKKVQYLMSFVMLISLYSTIDASSSAVRASRLLAAQASKSGIKPASKTAPVINPVLTSSSRSLTSNAPKFKVQQQSFSTKIPKDPHAAGAQSSSAKMSMSKKVGVIAGLFAAGAFVWNGISNAYQSVVDAISPIDMESRPNFKQAVSFLKIKCKSMQLAPDVDIEYVAYLITNFNLSYRKIDQLLQKAEHDYALQQNRTRINIDDINKALSDLYLEQFNFDDIRVKLDALTVSHHEAGHALVIALYLSQQQRLFQIQRLEKVGITIPMTLDRIESWVEKMKYSMQSMKLYEFQLVTAFAGGIAQYMLLSPTMLNQYKDKPEYLELSQQKVDMHDFDAFLKEPGVSADMHQAREIAKEIAAILINLETMMQDDFFVIKDQEYAENIENKIEAKTDEILRAAHKKTIEMLEQHKDQLKEIADVIYEEGSISGQRVYEIVGQDAPMLRFEHDRIIDEIEGDFYDYR